MQTCKLALAIAQTTLHTSSCNYPHLGFLYKPGPKMTPQGLCFCRFSDCTFVQLHKAFALEVQSRPPNHPLSNERPGPANTPCLDSNFCYLSVRWTRSKSRILKRILGFEGMSKVWNKSFSLCVGLLWWRFLWISPHFLIAPLSYVSHTLGGTLIA